MRRLGSFLGFKILNFNIFEGFVDILWRSSQNRTVFRGGGGIISMRFWSRYRIGDIFGVAKISNIFLGARNS